MIPWFLSFTKSLYQMTYYIEKKNPVWYDYWFWDSVFKIYSLFLVLRWYIYIYMMKWMIGTKDGTSAEVRLLSIRVAVTTTYTISALSWRTGNSVVVYILHISEFMMWSVISLKESITIWFIPSSLLIYIYCFFPSCSFLFSVDIKGDLEELDQDIEIHERRYLLFEIYSSSPYTHRNKKKKYIYIYTYIFMIIYHSNLVSIIEKRK